MDRGNPGGDSNRPPPPMAFPPEASAPPVHMGYPGPPQANVGTPVHNVIGTNAGVWTTGLFGCFNDLSNCLITCFCPCITFGQDAEIIDRGRTSCACAGALCCLIFIFFDCSFWYTCTYRTKLRGLYSILGDQCGDCCVHFWREPCALCQEYRELKNRGFDPSIGNFITQYVLCPRWVANEERRTRLVGIVVPPSVPGGMIR
ncbi:hypothetical protein BT93_F0122 [Corymbia citriodora subsp. variegata]|nr:hypothetical protein BT93_F0122 [Corymbia citriodora subsp. variegata]